jgi:ketosteroid isomerase-like protein
MWAPWTEGRTSGRLRRGGGLRFRGLTSLDAAGRPVISGGPYLTAWRRDADGHWKIVRNIAF